MKLFFILILLSGCAYSGYTHIRIKGDEVNVPVAGMTTIKGKNVDVEMYRMTNFEEKSGECLCLGYADIQGLCSDKEWK